MSIQILHAATPIKDLPLGMPHTAGVKAITPPNVSNVGSSLRMSAASLAANNLSPEPPADTAPATNPVGYGTTTFPPPTVPQGSLPPAVASAPPPVKGVAHSLLHRQTNRMPGSSGMLVPTASLTSPVALTAPVQEFASYQATNTAAVVKDLGTMHVSTGMRAVSPLAPKPKRDIVRRAQMLDASLATGESQMIENEAREGVTFPTAAEEPSQTALRVGQVVEPLTSPFAGPTPASIQTNAPVDDALQALSSNSSQKVDNATGSPAMASSDAQLTLANWPSSTPLTKVVSRAQAKRSVQSVHDSGHALGVAAAFVRALPHATTNGTSLDVAEPLDSPNRTAEAAACEQPAMSSPDPSTGGLPGGRAPSADGAMVSGASAPLEELTNAGLSILTSACVPTDCGEEAAALAVHVDAPLEMETEARAVSPETVALSPPPQQTSSGAVPVATSPPSLWQPASDRLPSQPSPSPSGISAPLASPSAVTCQVDASPMSASHLPPTGPVVHENSVPPPPSPGDLSDGAMDWEMTPASTPVLEGIPVQEEDVQAGAAFTGFSLDTVTSEHFPRATSSVLLPSDEPGTALPEPPVASHLGGGWDPESSNTVQTHKGPVGHEGASQRIVPSAGVGAGAVSTSDASNEA